MIDINEELKGKWVRVSTTDNRFQDGYFVDFGEGLIILKGHEGRIKVILSDKIISVEEMRDKK